MKLWYWSARLLVAAILLGVFGLGLVASLPAARSTQAAVTPGILYAWGYNFYGQLGDGTNTTRNTPEPISLPNGATTTAIAAGTIHNLAIGSNGKLYAWGANYIGQLGDGTTTIRNTPEPISLPNGASPTAIAAGYQHSLAIGSDGNVYAWGDNEFGQLGDGNNSGNSSNIPVKVSLPTGVTPTAIAAGFGHSLAIGSNGTLYAWGDNAYGDLGNGSNGQRNTPTPVSLPTGFIPIAITAGDYHNLAIGSNGTLYAWGYNNNGQLGDGSTLNHSIPTLVNFPTGFIPTTIAAGKYHSLAIGSNGTLYAWGYNNSGQLGDGSTTNHSIPTLVNFPDGATPTAITAGASHSLAIGSNGKLYAWGYNNSGQLGDGSTLNHSSPTLVGLPNGATPIAITAGFSHSLAIVTPPAITINNVTQNEGNSGTTPFQFTVSLSYATSQTVTVEYATADGTATAADNDYQPITGTLSIPPNQITSTLTVQVNGDTKFERDESFTLALTNPTNATLGTPSTGTGTILNDDSCNALLVTTSGDDGSCGTLRAALAFASTNPTKTVNIQLSAGSVISLTTGLTLTTGVAITTTAQCGVGAGNTMLPPITIQGVGTSSGNGLTLAGHNSLYGLWVRGFSGVQIKAPPGSTTKMLCVRASKL